MLRKEAGDSGEAPKQFSQPSRKGKKAWRKNVDVTAVEDGLVELNKELISGYVADCSISLRPVANSDSESIVVLSKRSRPKRSSPLM